MYFLESCVEEIALEGLDGITLSSLWIRLSNRPDCNGTLDAATKDYLWRFIRQHKEMNFYLIPEQRPDICVNVNFDEEEMDMYPICVINKGWGPKDSPETRVWGSCRFYDVRNDVTRKIKSSQLYESLDFVNNQFGNSFVIVASTIVRVKYLIGTGLDPVTFLTQNVSSALQYACLERIGRSRFKGETSLGKIPLHVACNMRPKDMFYVLTQLERFGVIKKQTFSVMIFNQMRYGTVSTLTRYYSPTEPNFYLGKMKELVLFLDKQPDKKAKGDDIRAALQIERKTLKKTLQAYPEVIDKVTLKVPNERFLEFCEKQHETSMISEAAIEVDDSSDDDSVDRTTTFVKRIDKKQQPPKASISRKFYRLSGKFVYNEETGEWKKEEEEENDDSDEDVDVQQTSWLHQNPYRTKLYEILRLIREAKSAGVVANDLRKKLALRRKVIDRLLNNALKTGVINSVTMNCGKMRRRLYVWACEQHESNAAFRKFSQLSGISLENTTEKEKLLCGERNIRRMNMILESLEEVLVLQRFELLKKIRSHEREEGYKFEMDRKCLTSLVEFLYAHDAIRIYTTVLTCDNKTDREVNYVCHRTIDSPQNETLRGHMNSLQRAFQNVKNVSVKSADGLTKSVPIKKKKRKLTSDDVGTETSTSSATKLPKLDAIISGVVEVVVSGGISVSDIVLNNTATVQRPVQSKQNKSPRKDDVTSIMTYNLGAQEKFGLQGKLVRCEILHEFLFYWLCAYEGKLVERSTLSKNEDDREPDVYLDENSWKRYVPPPFVRDAVPSKQWFLLSDMIAVLPVCLIAMTCNNPYFIKGFDEILMHPVKRFYLLSQIPQNISLALQRDRRLSHNCSRICMILCAQGILSLGPSGVISPYSRLDEDSFYLHKSTKLLDTSTTPYRFYIVAPPMSRYKEYLYTFDQAEDVELYWLHFRAICCSSRLGHRNCKTQDEAKFDQASSKDRKSWRDVFSIKRIKFEEAVPDGNPVEPRIGGAGLHPHLFGCRVINWKLNRNPPAVWFFDEMRRRMFKYEKEIANKVASLSISWNSFVTTDDLIKNVLRLKYKSPLVKNARQIMKEPRVPEDRMLMRKTRRFSNVVTKPSIKRKRQHQHRMELTDPFTFENKSRLRSRFSLRENQMMLLARAVSLLVCPNQKMWVSPKCVRDLMYKYVPESRDKTAKCLMAHSARDINAHQPSFDSMMMMMNQLKKNQEMKNIKKRYPMLSLCSSEQKTDMFTELFEKAREIFSSGSSAMENSVDVEEVLKKYSVVYDCNENVFRKNDVENVANIYEATVFNTYLSLFSLSRRDGMFTGQLNEIYKKFPHPILSTVVGMLRRDGLIVSILPHRTMMKQAKEQKTTVGDELSPAAGGLRRHLTFSYYYRHFFYHKFHLNLYEDAMEFCCDLRNKPNEFHEIVLETPGFIPVLINFIYRQQIDIDLTLPEMILALPDDKTTTDTNEFTAPRKLVRHESDSSDDEMQNGDGGASVYKPMPAGTSVNKTILYKLRCERLQAVEKADYRSVNMRVNTSGLNRSEIKVMLHSTTESDDCFLTNKQISHSLEKLSYKIPENRTKWEDYKNSIIDDDLKLIVVRIYETVASYGSLGVCENDLIAMFSGCDLALKQLERDYLVVKCGSINFRYVAAEFITPWAVTSFKMPKESARSSTDPNLIESQGIPVTFLPRPWIRPDGSLNRPMLKWLCEGIFYRVLSMAGMTQDDVCDQFRSVLQPTSVQALLDFLDEVGCVVKRVDEIFERQPTLFGDKKVREKTIVSYHVAINGVTKFASLFTKTPLPDFISICSSGDEILEHPKNLFSRHGR